MTSSPPPPPHHHLNANALSIPKKLISTAKTLIALTLGATHLQTALCTKGQKKDSTANGGVGLGTSISRQINAPKKTTNHQHGTLPTPETNRYQSINHTFSTTHQTDPPQAKSRGCWDVKK
jgi:hypothetical protein